MMRNSAIALMVSSVFGLGACQKSSSDPGSQTSTRTVSQLLQSSFDVSLFNEAMKYTGLADSLNNGMSYTIFAPEDEAFQALGIASTAQIDTMDKGSLTHLLKYHILYGQDIPRLQVNSALNNPFVNWDRKTLYISRPYSGDAINNNNFIVNGDTVVQADILASNGVLHTLKTVLSYQAYNSCADYLSADTGFSFFVTALRHFNLYGELQSAGPITVLAPNNDAFRSVGISLDSVNRLDTVHYLPQLFACYLMPNYRFYSGLSYINYYSPDGTYQVTGTSYYQNGVYVPGAYVNAYDGVTHDLFPLFSKTDRTANAYVISQNNPAGNGVVMVLNSTLAGPDACRKR